MVKRKASAALAPPSTPPAALAVKRAAVKPVGPWERVMEARFHYSVAVDREVDEKTVHSLLAERTAAKKQKDWSRADEIAAELQEMDVCYVDEKRVWYTRKISSAEDKARRLKKTKSKMRKVADKKGGEATKTTEKNTTEKAGAVAKGARKKTLKKKKPKNQASLNKS